MSATVSITQTGVCHPADLMRRAWSSFTAKRAAAAADRSHRTTEGWLSGRGQPSLADALLMAERDADFRRELSRQLDEIEARLEGKNHG